MIAAKFGIEPLRDGDEAIADDGLRLLQSAEVDYTNFFRALGELGEPLPDDEAALLEMLGDVFYDEGKRAEHQGAIAAWLRRWHARVSRDGTTASARRARMHAVNPMFVLRNYLAQEAIDRAESGDASGVHELLDLVRRPYDEQPGRERFAARRPDWARHKAGCSMLSCSS